MYLRICGKSVHPLNHSTGLQRHLASPSQDADGLGPALAFREPPASWEGRTL